MATASGGFLISESVFRAIPSIAVGRGLGFDATKKFVCEGFKRLWSPLIKIHESVKAKVEELFGGIA